MENNKQVALEREALTVERGAVWERPVLEVLGAEGTAGAKLPSTSETAFKVGAS